MAENPLLPDRELRALHALLGSAQKLEAAAARLTLKASKPRRPMGVPAGGREALLAGTLIQLRPGDLLVAESADGVVDAVLRTTADFHNGAAGVPALPPGGPTFLLASAMAAALKTESGDRLVLAIGRAGSLEPDWATALAWAQQHSLPLILACVDRSDGRSFQAPQRSQKKGMTWTAFSKVARRLGLPVLSVDGEDVVAVYRVMQESVLRARTGGGPAALWAMLPALQQQRPPSAVPVARLRRYLRTRGISL